VIIAGDFNDWRNQLSEGLASGLQVHDVFSSRSGQDGAQLSIRVSDVQTGPHLCARFRRVDSQVHGGRRMSDHAALLAELKIV